MPEPFFTDRLGALADGAPLEPATPAAAPRAPGQVTVYDNATGEQIDLDPEEATAQFKAGKVNLVKGAPVGVVDPDTGETRTATPEDVSATLARGGTLAGADTAHHSELAKEYGGLKGAAISGAMGLADAASGGNASQLAGVIGGGLLHSETGEEGGRTGSEQVLDALRASRDEHGIIRGAGELAGMALAPGMRGARLLGGGAVAGLAQATGGAIAKDAAGLGARALAKGFGGAVENAGAGALLAEGGAFSESALNDGDHQLTGEQVLARMGHGAVLGTVIGGIAGAGIEAARTGAAALRGPAATVLERGANREMWRDINSGLGITKQAMRRVEGGTEALGETARSIGLDNPALSPEEQLSTASAAKEATGGEIGDMYRRSGATAKPSELIEKLDGLIADVDKTAGRESTVKALRTYRASLIDKLSRDAEEAGVEGATAAPARAPIDPRHQAFIDEIERLKAAGAPPKQLSDLEAMRAEMFGAHPSAAPVEMPGLPKPVADAPVSLEELWRQRVGLNRLVYQETKALDPNLRVEVLREFSHHFGDFLKDAGEKAAPGEFADALSALNKRYQHLALINDSLEIKAARYLTNRRFSLTDSIMQAGGAGGAATALMAGHPLVAAGSMALGMTNKLLRERGPRVAAWLMGRASTFEGADAHVDAIDSAISRATTGLIEGRAERAAPAASGVFRTAKAVATAEHVDEVRDTYEAKVGLVRQAAEHPELAQGIEAHLSGVAQHAPQVAAAAADTAKRATAYLASTAPQTRHIDPLRPEESSPPSMGEMSKWLRRVDAVDDPTILFDQVRSLRLDPVTIESVQAVYPRIFQKLQASVRERVTEKPGDLSRAERLSLSPIAGFALTASASPAAAAARQATFANASAGAQPHGAPAKSSSSKNQHGPSLATGSERVASGG